MGKDYQSVLTALKSNQSSGASELALRTLLSFKEYLSSVAEQSADTIETMAAELASARPSMIPLANALRRWQKKLESDAPYNKAHYIDMLDDIYQQLANASDKVAEQASELIKPGMTVLTHSRSSQVMSLFEHAWEQYREFRVMVTLSAPGNEGLAVASQLSKMGVPVTVITDAEMGLVMPDVDLNISGCDCWLTDHHYVNKTGTLLQALAARHFGKPFWVLADSFKNSHQTSDEVSLEAMPADELPLPEGDKIAAKNVYFETVSTRLMTGRVDEYGLQVLQP